MPQWDFIPRWYELSWEAPATLIIRIHRVAFAEVQSLWGKSRLIEPFRQEYSLPEFTPSIQGVEGERIGFGEVLVAGKPEGDWLVYRCPFPRLTKRGGGNLEGERVVKAFALRGTLEMLFSMLWIFEGETPEQEAQLLVVEGMMVAADLHGGSLSATVTPTLAQWLEKQPNNSELSEVTKVMHVVYEHLWPDSEWRPDRREFRALCRHPHWINMAVPGNACGLDPEDYYERQKGRGYKLCPHNVDSSFQQLSLLAGLAKLHDLARGR